MFKSIIYYEKVSIIDIFYQKRKENKCLQFWLSLLRSFREKKNVTLKSCSGRIQTFGNKYELTGNDKEACSLMLFMDMVEVGGTVVGILKEGVVFDKKYTQLRKCLVEKLPEV